MKTSPLESYQGFSGGKKIDEGIAAGVLAERYVVGAILANNALYEISQPLSDRDFEDVVCRRIYGVVARVMQGEVAGITRIDPVTCTSFPEVSMFITPARLSAMAMQASAVNEDEFCGHVDLIRHRAGRRNLLEQVNELHALISRHDVTNTQVSRAIRAIGDNAVCNSVQTRTIGEFGRMAIDAIAQSAQAGRDVPGIATGFRDLDQLTGGLFGGQMIVIAGRPAMGKTAFALNMVEYIAATEGKNVLLISLEMSGEELAKRMIASVACIDSNKLKTGALSKEEWDRLAKAGEYLDTLPIDLSESGSVDYDRLIQSAKRAARHGRLDMIVVDYIQLMNIDLPGAKGNRQAQISEISRGCKNLARELGIPFVALSQLSRKLEERQDKRPLLSDLRESGAIEQDADVVLFVYRDEVYNPATIDQGIAEIIVAKQRSGAIGTIRLGFQGGLTAFRNLSLDGKPEKNVNLQSIKAQNISSNRAAATEVGRRMAVGDFLQDDASVMNMIYSASNRPG